MKRKLHSKLPSPLLPVYSLKVMVRFRTFTVLALLVVATLLGGGCTSFNRDWQIAANHPVQVSEVQGPWQGFWRSDANGHTGRLRCLVTKSGDGIYRARFHANYSKVLSFGYTVKLKTESVGDSFNFRGQANLGWLAGGVYYYEGHADQTNFFSNYSNKYDHGTFQMTRP